MFIFHLIALCVNNAAYYAQGVVDGMANALDNLDVQYTYHVHSGDASTIGGCYGNITKQCPGRYITTKESWFNRCWWSVITCNSCGVSWTNEDGDYAYKAGSDRGKCTRAVSGIGLSCGKTEQTIASATIIY